MVNGLGLMVNGLGLGLRAFSPNPKQSWMWLSPYTSKQQLV